MTDQTAITGARIFDGEIWHEDAALIIDGARIVAIADADQLPAGTKTVPAGGALIYPGSSICR